MLEQASLASFGKGGEGVVGVRYANPRRLAGARNAWDVVKAAHGAACDLQNFGAGRKPKAR